MRKFIQAQANIYACYHNSIIKALCNNDGTLAVVDKHDIVLWIFENDEEIEGYTYKTMRFNEFFNLLVKENHNKLGYYYSNYYLNNWQQETYRIFNKDKLDKFINEELPEESRSTFDFLKQ